MKISRRHILKASLIALARYVTPKAAYPDSKEDFFDVTLFGAAGDGRRDDTEAISRAMAKAASSKRPAHIFFPKGTYLFTNIEEYFDDVEISGENATIISTLPIGTPTPALWLHGNRIWIHDLTIDYRIPLDIRDPGVVAGRKPNAYGLRLGGSRDPVFKVSRSVLVERISVSNARGGGIQISYSSNVTVRKCKIRQVLGNGLGFDDCLDNVVAEDNDIALAGDDLLIIVTDKRVPEGTTNVTIQRNKVTEGYAKGIASSGVNGMTIKDNIVSSTFAGGIMVFSDTFYGLGSSRNVSVSGNNITNAGKFFGEGQFRTEPCPVGDSIYIGAGSANVTVVDNVVSSSVRDGIVVTNIDGLNISNNVVVDHPGAAILVGNLQGGGKTLITKFEIKSNLLQGNRDGILIGSAENGVVESNIITLDRNNSGRPYLSKYSRNVRYIE